MKLYNCLSVAGLVFLGNLSVYYHYLQPQMLSHCKGNNFSGISYCSVMLTRTFWTSMSLFVQLVLLWPLGSSFSDKEQTRIVTEDVHIRFRPAAMPWEIWRSSANFWEKSVWQNLRVLFLLLNIYKNDFPWSLAMEKGDHSRETTSLACLSNDRPEFMPINLRLTVEPVFTTYINYVTDTLFYMESNTTMVYEIRPGLPFLLPCSRHGNSLPFYKYLV